MDLSFPRFEPGAPADRLPAGDAAALLREVTALRAASKRRREAGLLQPLDGAFNSGMTTALAKWKEE